MPNLLNLRAPLSIAFYYLLLGVIWILITDFLVVGFSGFGSSEAWPIQNLKGILYVTITAIALYLVLRKNQILVLSQQHDLDMLFTSKDIGLLKADGEANITFISENIAHSLGYKSRELIGKNIRDITYSEDLKQDEKVVEQIKRGQIDTYHYEKRYMHRTGEPIWVEVSGMAYLEEGEIKGYVATTQNVMPLRESEQRTAMELIEKDGLINSTKDMIWSVDKDYNLVSSNKSFQDVVESISHIRPSRGQPGTLDQKIKSDDRGRWEPYYASAFKSKTLEILEKISINDKTYWYEISFNPIITDDEVIRISCFGRNVTDLIGIQDELQSTLKDLRETNAFIKTALNRLPIGVAVNKISDGSATFMNDKFVETYGWPAEDLVDVDTFFEKVYPDPEYRQEMRSRILRDIATGNPEQMVWKGIKITTKSGDEHIIDAKNIPVEEQDLMVSTVIDVTERMNHISTIEERNQQLKEIAWSHSHHLRAPLAKIMALIELIQSEDSELNKSSQSFSYLLEASHELDEIIRSTIAKSDTIAAS